MLYLVPTFTLLALVAPSFAAITPTSPDSTTVVNEGQSINALWDVDTTGTWTDVEIQLMTGPNEAMIPLSTLATGIDGTTNTSFTASAPAVTPNSAIYFLQFTLGGNVSTATWTTRFTIAAADGTSTPPTNSSLFDGNTVQWGIGALFEDSSTNSSMTASTSTSSSTSSSTTALAAAVVASSSSSTTAATGITVYTSKMTTSSNVPAALTSPAAASASSSKTSGAGRSTRIGFGGFMMAGVVMAMLV